jgi:phosphatidate cytidylyltransferase
MLLLPSWYALLLLKDINFIQLANVQIKGSELVLIMMFMIWSADTGAYFSGRKWGKTKLIVNVSPGKTRAGVYGAIISTSLLAITLSLFMFGGNMLYAFYAAIIATIIVIVSVIGDLFESMYKRNSGIKDSGNILPGHGGILDRIDSLTSVAPVFYTIIYFLVDKPLINTSIGQLS